MRVAEIAEQPRKLALVWRQHHLMIVRRLDRFEQTVRRIGKAGQRIGVQHQPPLRRERGMDEIPDMLADAGAGTDDAGIEALVAHQLGEFDDGVDLADHDGGQRRSVYRERLAWRGQCHEPGPRT